MPNVNELHRQAWAEYQDLEFKVHQRIPKSEKKEIFARMRELERELDIEGADYNSSAFGHVDYSKFNWNGDKVK